MANASDKDLRCQIYEKLKEIRAVIEKERKNISLLKRHAATQEKYQEKKQRQLEEEDQAVIYSLDFSIEFVENILPTCSSQPYFSTNEVALSLDCINTQQIQLSNTAFVEDFSNLPSTNSLYLSEVYNSRDTLSDTE
ncbi:9849_t:CDS:2 [Dentiscutata erythropus]|uniref:9849_t:CDS:1 n=1 Tax=Dentiscutata erythropus TaxID=1348616 RepID=A0A9N9NUT6_9GLOM|nr:9849_t:CDS:2 [Dentiscutata erythropus]